MKLRAGILGLAMLAASAAGAQPVPTPTALYQQLSPSVWLVRTFDAKGAPIGSGSAVVIAPETLLTNCHVLAKGSHYTVTNDNVGYGAIVQYVDVARDMCQIRARNLPAPAAALGDSDKAAVGERVYALGNPLGMERTFSDGLVSGLVRDEESRALLRIQTTAPISPGSSGGGLFDAQGRLIGLTSSHLRDSQNINFAIPINWLRDLPTRDAAARAAASSPTLANATPPAAARNVGDVDAVPVGGACKDQYRKFLASAVPRAFAVTATGKCSWANGWHAPHPEASRSLDPKVRAVDYCRKINSEDCSLYAVDGQVVWSK